MEPYFVAGGVDERAAREEAACKVLSNHRKVLPSAAPGESAASVSRRPSWTPTRNLPMTPLWPLVPTF